MVITCFMPTGTERIVVLNHPLPFIKHSLSPFPSGPKVTSTKHSLVYSTTHDPSTGTAIIHSQSAASWISPPGADVAFNLIYTTSEFPAQLTDEVDIKQHESVVASRKLGLVNPNGTICRMVDFKPGSTPLMHRTQSLDYGIVLEGSVIMELDSGEKVQLHRGDVAVQRATMHAWRNASETDWARIVFVLQDCQPLLVGGQRLKEDLGHATEAIPPSGNDK